MKSFIGRVGAISLLGIAHAASAGGLYFSEYVEGSSNNKALEIYNDTGASVSLTGYRVALYFNGATTAATTINLSGTLAAGATFVVAHSSAAPAVTSAAQQISASLTFNGDDAVVLLDPSGNVVDAIGQVGFNPGTEWGTGGVTTANHTLRRKASVTSGDTNPSNTFDPALEWDGFAQDTFNGLGSRDAGSPPPAASVRIFDIQGTGHTSPRNGQSVATGGIVTARLNNGFYLQDPEGDGNPATSDGIFVFTSSAPTVQVGDAVTVNGSVTEYVPGGATTNNLSITEIVSPTVTVISSGNPLPAPAVIGLGGRLPPTQIIDDDGLTVFDPANDGIDFYESLEGMRVLINNPRAVSTKNRFGEIYVLAEQGAYATGTNARGGITIALGDFNPERTQVQLDGVLLPGFSPAVNVGDLLGPVTGVVSFAFGNFEVLATEPFAVTGGGLAQETTGLTSGANQLTIAGFNVENLDPKREDQALVQNNSPSNVDDDVADGKFAALAAQIVQRLRSPDILALQEIQDNDGAEVTSTVDASLTYQTLIDAIRAAGGPQYQFADLPPVAGQDGGQPGGNIRVGYLYNPARVGLVPGSLQRILDHDLSDGDAFADSRKPLLARFSFQGQELTLINNHFASKGGSSPLYGAVQPPINGGEAKRTAQALEVNRVVRARLTADPAAKIVVLGDLNEFQFFPPLTALAGPEPLLFNLSHTLPAESAYTYVFEGNSQALDHILVSQSLRSLAEYDIVHVNAEFQQQASDHDATLVRLTFPGAAPVTLLAEFDALVAQGAVLGLGSGTTASANLTRMRKLIEQTQSALAGQDTATACRLIATADTKMDGDSRDWIVGSGLATLRARVADLRQSHTCTDGI